MIAVVCGIIFKNDKVFIARRKLGKQMEGKWEFPGGKITPNESEEAALERELLEELGMTVNILDCMGALIHNYSDFTIKLIAYKCAFINASFELNDHDAYLWVSKEALYNFDLTDADKPFIDVI